MSAYYEYTAVLKRIGHTLSGLGQITCITREDTSSVRPDPRLDRFLHRTHTDLVSRLRDIQLCLCDPLIFPDIRQCLFLVDSKDAVSQGQLLPENDIFHIEITDL